MMMIGGRDNVISGDMGGFGGGLCSACGYFFIVFLIVGGGVFKGWVVRWCGIVVGLETCFETNSRL